MGDSALVVLRTFLNNIDAQLAVSALEAAGIDAAIRSDDCGGLRPHLWMSGVGVLVRSDQAQRADEVLENDAMPADRPEGGGDR